MPVVVSTFAQLKTASQSEVTRLAPTLTDYREGSNLDAVTGAAAVVADTVILHGVVTQRECFVETAEGAALDRLIESRTGGAVVRLPATAARTTLTLTRSSYAGAYTFTAGKAVTGVAPDGTTITFTADAEVVLSAPSSSTTIAVTCSVTGPDGNVPAATLVTSTLPTGLALTQPSRAAGGNNAETDDYYRGRYRLFLQARQQGTPAALEYAARTVATVRFAAVDESNIGGAAGTVVIYIADSTGEGSEALAEDVLYAIDYAEFNGLVGARSAGAVVDVVAAVREEVVDLEFTVKIRAGSGISEDDVKTAVLAYFDTLEPGATLYPSAPEEAIRQISDDVLDAEMTNPTGPRAPTLPYNSVRTADDGSDITVTIVEV